MNDFWSVGLLGFGIVFGFLLTSLIQGEPACGCINYPPDKTTECPPCNASASCTPQTKTILMFENHTELADCPPKEPGWRKMTYGISMMPALSVENWVKVKDYNKGMKLTSGNWVLFDKNGEKTVHRVNAVYSDSVITQGLNNEGTDGEITYEQVKGIITDVRFC
jgi:hypothetical protein